MSWFPVTRIRLEFITHCVKLESRIVLICGRTYMWWRKPIKQQVDPLVCSIQQSEVDWGGVATNNCEEECEYSGEEYDRDVGHGIGPNGDCMCSLVYIQLHVA